LVSTILSNRPDITTIGSTTFGKGRGQALAVTPMMGLAAVTYALLEPINGESYDMVGIDPEVSVPENEDPLEVAMELAVQGLARYSRQIQLPSLRRVKYFQSTFKLKNRKSMCYSKIIPNK